MKVGLRRGDRISGGGRLALYGVAGTGLPAPRDLAAGGAISATEAMTLAGLFGRRVDVEWYEAVAFCRWLTARLALPESSVRLPTELEWEKAARGERGLAYPGGPHYRSGFANVDEAQAPERGPWHLNQPSAVGVYPHGRSPYGVEDLAGTVWEWCLNKRDDLDAVAADASGAARALRGGSWGYHPHSARAVIRDWGLPDLRSVGWGLRLLSSVPIDADR